MLKYFISYIVLYSSFIGAQIVSPVTISVESEISARAGEVIDVHVDANMDDEWKIYSIYKIVEGPLPTEVSLSGEAVGMTGLVIEPKPTEECSPKNTRAARSARSRSRSGIEHKSS